MTTYGDRLRAGEFDPPDGTDTSGRAAAAADAPLGEMTKGELIERAQSKGVSPANASMTKEDLIAAIEAAS